MHESSQKPRLISWLREGRSCHIRKLINSTLKGVLLLGAGLTTQEAMRPVFATPVNINVGGTDYTLNIVQCFENGVFCSATKSFKTNPWYGNQALAGVFSNATQAQLGLPNSAYPINVGPYFVYSSQSPITNNFTSLGFSGYQWDSIINSSYDSGGLWNSYTGVGTYNNYWIAVAMVPILESNNASGINVTSNLGLTVLPIFQGGTLTVAPSATQISSNFTINDSTTNAIDSGTNNATFSGVFSNEIGKTGTLRFRGQGITELSGYNTYTGNTVIEGGSLNLTGSLASANAFVQSGATLIGTGAVNGNLYNFGTVSPGSSNALGTLSIGGSFVQDSNGKLQIDVNGSSSDLLQLTGANKTIVLGGELNISSLTGTQITAGKSYTAISVPAGTQGGEAGLKTTFGVVGATGYKFVRETDSDFSKLDNGTAQSCSLNDTNCTKLQFGWLQYQAPTTPSTSPQTISTTLTPGATTIAAILPTGGAITISSSGDPTTNTNTCIANNGNASTCSAINTPGSGSSGSNTNTSSIAKQIDAGNISLQAAVTQAVPGGTPIPTPSGGTSGYTTSQASAALVTPDFVNVVGALFAVPNRQQLNQALHSISAEPYASMQSVALEALEQFRANSLALNSSSKKLPFVVEEEVCRSESKTLKDSKTNSDCKPQKISRTTPWSLIFDGSNTQAGLKSTNELASFDYNVFSTIYGLQYDFNRHWSAGAAFGFGQANLYNYEYSNATINSSTYSGSIWGIYRPSDAWKITGLLGYMNLQYDSSRNMQFGGLNRTATAKWSGNGFTTALAAEYDWILSSNKANPNAIRLKPNTFLSYALHSQGNFTESGADALNLAIASHTADSLIYGIGFTLETPVQLAKATRLIPRFSVGYQYDFNGNSNEERQISSSFAEVPALGSVDVQGQNRGANAVDLALNLELETSNQLSIYAGVGGAFWSNGTQVNYGGGLRYRW